MATLGFGPRSGQPQGVPNLGEISRSSSDRRPGRVPVSVWRAHSSRLALRRDLSPGPLTLPSILHLSMSLSPRPGFLLGLQARQPARCNRRRGRAPRRDLAALPPAGHRHSLPRPRREDCPGGGGQLDGRARAALPPPRPALSTASWLRGSWLLTFNLKNAICKFIPSRCRGLF